MLREKDNLLLLNLAFETSVFEQALNLSEFPDNCWAEDAPIQAMSLTANQVGRLQEAVQAVAVDRNRRNASWLVLTIARIITRSTHPAHHRGPAPEWMVNGLGKAAEPHLLREGMPGLYRAMGRSAEHVSRCFKTYFGLTPTEWLNRERIKRAQLLLATSGISILEIAMECGFESQSYFHKQFREQVGKSPLQYRKQLYRVQP
jgi:AraC family cel operon transcriptional repressor